MRFTQLEEELAIPAIQELSRMRRLSSSPIWMMPVRVDPCQDCARIELQSASPGCAPITTGIAYAHHHPILRGP